MRWPSSPIATCSATSPATSGSRARTRGCWPRCTSAAPGRRSRPSSEADDEVRPVAGGGDPAGVGLVAAQDPLARGLRLLAERHMAGDQPLEPEVLVDLDVPDLVEQRPDRRPAAVVE